MCEYVNGWPLPRLTLCDRDAHLATIFLTPTTHTSAFLKFAGKSLFARQPLMSIQLLQT